MKIHSATWKDCLWMRRCKNLSRDADTRKIGLREHLHWWRKDEERWVLQKGSVKMGYVRVDGGGVVSVAVMPGENMRQGIGWALIKYMQGKTSHRCLFAWIEDENKASLGLFNKCGFVETEAAPRGWHILKWTPQPGDGLEEL